jgi:hypothetical protein
VALAAIVAVGIAVRPALVVPVAIGAGVAAIAVGLLDLRRRSNARRRRTGVQRIAREAPRSESLSALAHRSDPAPAPRATSSRRRAASGIVGVLGIVIAVLGSLHVAGVSVSPTVRRGVPSERGVEPMAYHAVLEYMPSTGRWLRAERVRIQRHLLRHDSGLVRRDLLGGRWRYGGLRGAHGSLALYRRAITMTIATHGWPILTEAQVALPVLDAAPLRSVLVPEDGSVVELRAPERMIYETDPSATRQTFAGEDILSLPLAGLEDDPDQRTIRFEVANSLGRNAVYAGLHGLTAGTLVWGLFVLFAVSVAGYFINRVLKRLWP